MPFRSYFSIFKHFNLFNFFFDFFEKIFSDPNRKYKEIFHKTYFYFKIFKPLYEQIKSTSNSSIFNFTSTNHLFSESFINKINSRTN